jgi:hypothetical protein
VKMKVPLAQEVPLGLEVPMTDKIPTRHNFGSSSYVFHGLEQRGFDVKAF